MASQIGNRYLLNLFGRRIYIEGTRGEKVEKKKSIHSDRYIERAIDPHKTNCKKKRGGARKRGRAEKCLS